MEDGKRVHISHFQIPECLLPINYCTQFGRIKACGSAGWPPQPIIFERLKLPLTAYITSERKFIGESESSKILGKYFDFAIL